MIDALTLSGWIAGAVIATAAVPKLVDKIIHTSQAKKINMGDMLRDTMIVFGNLLWVLFGYFNSLLVIVVFCGINAILTSVLVFQNIRSSFKYRQTC